MREYEAKIAEHERIFRVIKDATGVSDVNLVIQKFLTQEDTHRNLQQLVREGQQKIEVLSQERADLKKKVLYYLCRRYSNPTHTHTHIYSLRSSSTLAQGRLSVVALSTSSRII